MNRHTRSTAAQKDMYDAVAQLSIPSPCGVESVHGCINPQPRRTINPISRSSPGATDHGDEYANADQSSDCKQHINQHTDSTDEYINADTNSDANAYTN